MIVIHQLVLRLTGWFSETASWWNLESSTKRPSWKPSCWHSWVPSLHYMDQPHHMLNSPGIENQFIGVKSPKKHRWWLVRTHAVECLVRLVTRNLMRLDVNVIGGAGQGAPAWHHWWNLGFRGEALVGDTGCVQLNYHKRLTMAMVHHGS